MASVARTAPRPTRWPARLRRLVPAEGWATVFLHAVVVLAAAWTVQRADWAPAVPIVSAVSLGGLLVGLVLGKARAPDLLAHLTALWGGLIAVVWATAAGLDPAIGGRRERLRFLWEEALEWYRRTLAGRPADDQDLFVVVMGLTLWLVAYTSAWVLYRRGWLTTAVALPGIIVVVNLGYSPGGGTRPLLVYLVVACVLAARHHAFRREREWARTRTPRPARLPWRFLGAGINLALLVGILGWTLPLSTRGAVSDTVWTRLDRPLEAVEDRWEAWFGDWGGSRSGSGGGSYASFGESFNLGGRLNLSDDPVAVLSSAAAQPRPTYLVGHRYGRYDGRGWSSDVEATFEETVRAGRRYSPQMTFAIGQAVPLSRDVTTSRAAVEATVEVRRPKGNLLFTTDTYQTASRRTSVQLSWRQLRDERYDLRSPNLNSTPVDVRGFALLLQRTIFPRSTGGADAADSPMPTDRTQAEDLAAERQALAERFVDTRWTVGPDGRATTLSVTGQVPVYDDVEAVFAGAEESVDVGQSYAVKALASTALAQDLARAGGDDPAYVRDRYLQLPETVTAQTEALARQLADGLDDRFAIATAVQDFVRARIAYNENIAAPPRGRDVVDYVLFESKQGYCEYYASAMAVLLRTLDIPARVVGGYFAVPFDPAEGGFLYREKNAHLWVEVFFPGYGWIPFEPTSGREPLAYGDLDAPVDASPTPSPEPSPVPTAVPTPDPVATEPAMPPAPPDDPSLLDRSARTLGWASLVTGLVALVGIAAFCLVWLWGFRGLSPAGGFYARALRAGRFWGVRPTPTMTPAEYADRLGRAVPSARRPARVVADLYGRERYAAQPPAAGATGDGRAAWAELRRTLLRSLPKRRRRGGGFDRG